jgi:hypothetical protein
MNEGVQHRHVEERALKRNEVLPGVSRAKA